MASPKGRLWTEPCGVKKCLNEKRISHELLIIARKLVEFNVVITCKLRNGKRVANDRNIES